MEAHRPLAIRTFGASQKSHRCCGIASGRLPIASSIFTQQRRSHALANSPVQPLGFFAVQNGKRLDKQSDVQPLIPAARCLSHNP